jgi:hypothetical protein
MYGRVTWSYTTDEPGDDWFQVKFDASAWKVGSGGFGTIGTPGIIVNTTWDSSDIWLRRSFTLGPEDPSQLKLQVFHDEDAEVYINGALAAEFSGYISDYSEFELSPAAIAVLHQGENTIAVHCHQTTGGQGIDVGIVVPQPVDTSPAKK